MAGINNLVYWDTGIFLARFAQDRPPMELQGIDELFSLFVEGKLHICTSVLTVVEVLESQISSDQFEGFKKLKANKNFHFEDTTFRIAETAHTIRNFYNKNSNNYGGAKMTTPDSIHLATAINSNCATFYTFDGEDSKKARKHIKLLPLSGTIANRYYLDIKKPEPSEQYKIEKMQLKMQFNETGSNE